MADNQGRPFVEMPTLPWEQVQPVAVAGGEIPNGVAYDMYVAVQVTKTGWKVPAEHLSSVLGVQVTAAHLSAACKYVKNRRDRLNKSNKAGPYLQEPFNFFKRLTTESPKPSKKRKSAPTTLLQCNLQPSDKEDGSQRLKEDIKKLKKENFELKTEKSELKTEKSKLKKEMKKMLPTETVSPRHAQVQERHSQRIQLWKTKYFEQRDMVNKLNKQLMKLEKKDKSKVSVEEDIIKMKSVVTSQRSYYKQGVQEAEERELAALDAKQQMEKELKARIAFLENELVSVRDSDTHQDIQLEFISSKKDKKTYNENIRKCIYYLLSHQCPVEHVPKVLAFIVEQFTGHKLEALPHPSTVARMAREMGVISDVQSGTTLYEQEHCTVAWDASEISGAHINEVHIAAPAQAVGDHRQYLTLSVAELPGGKAEDYSRHIQDSVGDVAQTYSEWKGVDVPTVLSSMKEHLTCSMSDRVAVNHCVVEQLKAANAVNPEFLEVNCNIHPLDSLSSKARAELKATGVKGALWGNDCAAANLLHGMSKLRYKQGKGDPIAFKAYLQSRGIPLKSLPRYVGNRMHVVFHLAGMTVYLREDLDKFLTTYASARGGLTAAVSKDLRDPNIYEHLQVLGLFGKVVTGPWMTLFYTEEKSNLEMAPHLRTCVSGLQRLVNNPGELFTSEEDIFGQPLAVDSDPCLMSLKAVGPPNEELVKSVATAMLAVCQRQLKAYLTGEFSPKQQELAQSAPVHNMEAERLMAMTDAQKRRAPNAKYDFVDSKIKFKTNESMVWLQQHPTEEREHLINFSISRARQVAKEKDARRVAVHEEILTRMKQKARKKTEAERRAVERQVRILDAGARVTLQEVQELVPEDGPVDVILELLNNPAGFVGRSFFHTWYCEETKKDVTYVGHVLKLKRNKIRTFVISYREMDEDPDAAVDFDITRKQLITDMICGDLVTK